uniref:Major facilitator superfamily (MFS) profile domain-containing protein n=1 Tax=Timema monikensis TaxID=170555 RepID=A0A7R9HJB0_9NEOP|nr:unnamed protein product [Timema monikensis]
MEGDWKTISGKPPLSSHDRDSNLDLPVLSSLAQHETSELTKYATEAVDLAAYTQGTIVGWPSPVLPSLQSENSPIGGEPMTDEEASWMGSVLCLGALLLTPIYGYLSNNHSRKLTGYLVGIPPIICWLMIIFARSKMTLFIARFLIGAVGAGNTVLCPLYVTEIVEDDVRGSLGTYVMLFFSIGVLQSYIVGSYASYQVLGFACISLPILFVFLFYWMPESPVYLMSRNRHMESRKALSWLRGNDKQTVDREMEKLTEVLNISKEDSSSGFPILELFSKRGSRRAMLICMGFTINMGLSGSFALMTFTVRIFQESGSELSPDLSAICVAILQCASVFLTSVIIDRAGRKIIMIVSNMALVLCLLVMGAYYYLKDAGFEVSHFGWLPVVCLCSYVVAVNMGVMTVPWIVINEVFEPRVKSMAVTLCCSFVWAINFLTSKFFLPVASHVGLAGCYWFFGVVCLLGAVFCHLVMPETKNRSLADILKELAGEKRFTKP